MLFSKLDESALNLLHENGVFPEDDEQFIEHFFSEQVENEYSKLLQKLIDKEISRWYEKNCFFINEKDKFKMSICLVYQLIRTKAIRKSIRDSSNCVEQLLRDMNCSEEIIKKNTLDERQEKFIQGNMFFDLNHIVELTECFYRLTWILGINKTNVPLYTSDHPIGTYPHIKDSLLSMNGIGSPGVEVYFPLSPKYILLMWDANYHKGFEPHDRKYLSIDNVKDIERYNMLCAYNCNQYIYARENNFNLIWKMIDKEPNIFSGHIVSISHGENKYLPE